MKRFLVALMLVVSVAVSGFSKQYVRTYINTYPLSKAKMFAIDVNEQIYGELSLGSSVVSITPILNDGSYTIAVIVLYDDGVYNDR